MLEAKRKSEKRMMVKEEQNESQNSVVAVIETPEEQELDELVKLEDRIRTGVRHCFETGMLLERIRKEKLYQLRGYKSFQCYCEEMCASPLGWTTFY